MDRRGFNRRGIGKPQAASAAPAWTPASLPGVVLWLRADMGTTLNGSNVAAWADQSGNGNDFTQATDARRPTLATGSHGKAVLSFTGTVLSDARFLQGPSFAAALPSGGELWIVAKNAADPPAGGAGGIYKFGTDALQGTHIPFTNSLVYNDFASNSRKATGIDPGNLAAWHTHGVVSKANDWRMYFNGAQFYSTVTNTVSWAGTSLLGYDNIAAWLIGEVAELVIAPELSSSDRAQLQSYGVARYSI